MAKSSALIMTCRAMAVPPFPLAWLAEQLLGTGMERCHLKTAAAFATKTALSDTVLVHPRNRKRSLNPYFTMIEGSFEVKLPTIWTDEMARSTFPSQNVQNTPDSDHFWQLRCRKSARRCGTKHISKSKCRKHHMFAPLLEVEMSKKCTPLWREAHFQVKMYKTLGVRTTFGGSDVASLRFGSLHYTIHSTTLQYITLHYTPQHYNYNYRTTQLHSTTLHYTPLH